MHLAELELDLDVFSGPFDLLLTLVLREEVDLRHISVMRVSVAERVAHLRALLRSVVALSFEDAVRDADRMTVAVTLWALLELHKRGEASWDQAEPFGEITVRRLAHTQ